jgi:hypothetical protein
MIFLYKFDVVKVEKEKYLYVHLKINDFYSLMEYEYIKENWLLHGIWYSLTPYQSIYANGFPHLQFVRQIEEKDYEKLNQYMLSIQNNVLNDPKVKLKTVFYR